MARITRKRGHADGERRHRPLSERIVDENLGSYDHVPRQHERLRAAIADAETPESRSADLAEDHHDDDARHAQPDDQAARPNGGDHDEELVDAAWLYAWSYAALRASRGTPRTSDRAPVLSTTRRRRPPRTRT
jgi:hypothetical protein